MKLRLKKKRKRKERKKELLTLETVTKDTAVHGWLNLWPVTVFSDDGEQMVSLKDFFMASKNKNDV